MNLNELRDKAADFSDRKFGANNPVTAPVHHLKEEVEELLECFEKEEDPLDEFADCFLMMIDAFRKHYGDDVDMQKLIDACSDKLDVCETRVWGEPDEKGVYKHIKEVPVSASFINFDKKWFKDIFECITDEESNGETTENLKFNFNDDKVIISFAVNCGDYGVHRDNQVHITSKNVWVSLCEILEGGGVEDALKKALMEKLGRDINEGLPPYVSLDKIAMRLDIKQRRYYRDAGHWDVGFVQKNNKLYSVSNMKWINNVELIPIAEEEWRKDNEGYV